MNILPALMVLDWYILLKYKPVYIDLVKNRVQEDEKKTICMHIHIHANTIIHCIVHFPLSTHIESIKCIVISYERCALRARASTVLII